MEHPPGGTTRNWRRMLAHEAREYLFNFAFLAVFLVAFAWYRRLVLAAYDIPFHQYWAPLIEAAILAKVIMIGDAIHIGRKFQGKPLAVTTIYRTLVFAVLVVLFSLVEHMCGALIHGKPAADGVREIANKGVDEVVAQCVLVLAAFLPFFAVKELEREFGPENIRRLFLRGRAATDHGAAGDRGPIHP